MSLEGSWSEIGRGHAAARRADRGRVNHAAGAAAEDSVVRHYTERGCPVLARRWRGRGGEIDVIAADGDALVFVEVKKSRSHDAALGRVTERQVRRLMAAAQEFLATRPGGLLTDVRFDIGTVDASGDVRILENALA
ncbi:YraN family protein [Histidinibacterium lentulum]|uniref:UPF0102 protein EAT49_11355 n=1 Tax=Histidinibacterium lentulum TaxID=2480588 RepID=A0A3N2R1S3_9RHOB|nr:YraN family protein [Histidinibacterium lentulum]ROU01298.1 hypothetical protein EAT49_11355 [Histidinibacterium lentulum]